MTWWHMNAGTTETTYFYGDYILQVVALSCNEKEK